MLLFSLFLSLLPFSSSHCVSGCSKETIASNNGNNNGIQYGFVPMFDGQKPDQRLMFSWSTPFPSFVPQNLPPDHPVRQYFKKYEIKKGDSLFDLKPFEYSFNTVDGPPKTIVVPSNRFIQNVAESVVQANQMATIPPKKQTITMELKLDQFTTMPTPMITQQTTTKSNNNGNGFVFKQIPENKQFPTLNDGIQLTTEDKNDNRNIQKETPLVVPPLPQSSTLSTTESSKDDVDPAVEYRKLWLNLARSWQEMKHSASQAGLDRDMVVVWSKFTDTVEPYVSNFAESVGRVLRMAINKQAKKFHKHKDDKIQQISTSVSKAMNGEQPMFDAIGEVRKILFGWRV